MKLNRYFWILAAGIALAACQEKAVIETHENEPDPETGLVRTTIRCSIGGDTKTYLDSDGKVIWNEGNNILVIPADGIAAGTKYTFVAQGTGSSVDFEGSLPEGTTSVYAVYPAKDCTFADDYVQINCGSAQTGRKGSFVDSLQVMVAKGDISGGSLSFKNACGLVKVTVSGSDVTAINLKATDNTTIMAGIGQVHYDFSEIGRTTSSRYQITMKPSGTYFEPGDYYFTAWPCEVAGITLTYTTDSGIKKRSSTNTLKIRRSKIVTLPGSDADITFDNEVKVELNGTDYPLSQVGDSNLYEGTISAPASGTFVIDINGTDYGFLSYSGNGGVGTVANSYSCVPYYSISTNGLNSTKQYTVRKSIGRMAAKSSSGNDFWLNMDAAATIKVRVDMTYADELPRYYIERVIDDDDEVFYENFDLFVWGGDYGARATGKTASTKTDGTEAGSTTVQYTVTGYGLIDYPTRVSSTLVSNLYATNRGVSDWVFAGCAEVPNSMIVSNSTINGCVTTPTFSALSSSTDITLNIDLAHFGGGSNGPIAIKLIGSGTFTGGSVILGSGSSQALQSSFESSSKVYKVVAAECPAPTNNTVDKTVSHFSFNVSGADSTTQIQLHPYNSEVGTGNRFIIYKIEARK